MNEIGLVKSDLKMNIIDYLALNELLSDRIIPKSGERVQKKQIVMKKVLTKKW